MLKWIEKILDDRENEKIELIRSKEKLNQARSEWNKQSIIAGITLVYFAAKLLDCYFTKRQPDETQQKLNQLFVEIKQSVSELKQSVSEP